MPLYKEAVLEGKQQRWEAMGKAMYEEAVCEGAHVGGRLCVRKPVCFTNRRLEWKS